jgi:hypothetical protein
MCSEAAVGLGIKERNRRFTYGECLDDVLEALEHEVRSWLHRSRTCLQGPLRKTALKVGTVNGT